MEFTDFLESDLAKVKRSWSAGKLREKVVQKKKKLEETLTLRVRKALAEKTFDPKLFQLMGPHPAAESLILQENDATFFTLEEFADEKTGEPQDIFTLYLLWRSCPAQSSQEGYFYLEAENMSKFCAAFGLKPLQMIFLYLGALCERVGRLDESDERHIPPTLDLLLKDRQQIHQLLADPAIIELLNQTHPKYFPPK